MTCPHCEKYFTPPCDLYRRKNLTCSDACHHGLRMHRQRQRRLRAFLDGMRQRWGQKSVDEYLKRWPSQASLLHR